MNLYGINLANGPQDIARVISCGFDHYLGHEFETHYLLQCPGRRYLRLDERGKIDINAVAEKCLRSPVKDLIPWNEFNLPQERHFPAEWLGDRTRMASVYQAVSADFLALREAVGDKVALHFPAWTPFHFHKELALYWREAAEVSDVIDVHAYGTSQEILDEVDWYLNEFPHKELLLSEYNFGPNRLVDEEAYARDVIVLHEALLERPRVVGACGFIWRWYNPDTSLRTTLDWQDRPVERVVKGVTKAQRRDPMTWIVPGAISMIGKLPTRAGSAPYPDVGTAKIKGLVCHYVGIESTQATPPLVTARYQTTKTHGDPFPEIAYTFQFDPDGTVYQFHSLGKRTWHAGKANDESRGCLFTGLPNKGYPTSKQIESFVRVWGLCEEYLGWGIWVKGHRDYMATPCPGERYQEWLAEARQRKGGSIYPYADIFAKAAAPLGLDPGLLAAIARRESNFNPNAVGDNNTSFGLMQLNIHGAGKGWTREQLLDPDVNINLGATYLNDCRRAFPDDWRKAIAAYRQGIQGVKDNGPIDHENYLSDIFRFWEEYRVRDQVITGFQVINDNEWYCSLTGFKVAWRALELYKKKDGFFWLGYPRSDWRREGGVLVQWFQRGRLQVKPQYIKPDGQVDPNPSYDEVFEMGLLGDEALKAR